MPDSEDDKSEDDKSVSEDPIPKSPVADKVLSLFPEIVWVIRKLMGMQMDVDQPAGPLLDSGAPVAFQFGTVPAGLHFVKSKLAAPVEIVSTPAKGSKGTKGTKKADKVRPRAHLFRSILISSVLYRKKQLFPSILSRYAFVMNRFAF